MKVFMGPNSRGHFSLRAVCLKANLGVDIMRGGGIIWGMGNPIPKNNPEISVVASVYKVEKYLRACVDSILTQTFTDFELILVDDGSPDKSGEICDELAKKDPRVRVFHQENGGATSARKLGAESARGEWICFVDADDILPPNSLKDLFSETDDDTDWVNAMHQEFEDGETPKAEICSDSVKSLDLAGLVENTLFYHGFPWAKLIRKRLFSPNVFEISREIRTDEDTLMNFRLIANRPRRAKEIDKIVYYYRQREDSVWHLFITSENYVLRLYELFLADVEKFPDVIKKRVECAISRKIHRNVRGLLESCEPIKSPQKLARIIRPVVWKRFRYFFNYVCLALGCPQIAQARIKISDFLHGRKRNYRTRTLLE